MIVNAAEFMNYLAKTGADNHGYDQVIVPVKTSVEGRKELTFAQLDMSKNIEIDTMRTIGPLKYLFYLPRETVYPAEYPDTRRIIVGVKSCDLKALTILDKALLYDNFVDPSYLHWRSNTLIISSDCTVPAPACHCTLVGGQPFPNDGFDINISVVNSDYYIQVGTEAGKDFVLRMAETVDVKNADQNVKAQVESNRAQMTSLIEKLNQEFPKRDGYKGLKEYDIDNWKGQTSACVGCGACTHICPSCYCLVLNDETNGKPFVKVRSMDSCQYNGYARVAGGGTPRPYMHQRFRNRYLCKFSFMTENFGEIGCTGCGRCTEACAAQIDFRKVVEHVTIQEAV